jgi:hypothetical protein
VQGFVNVKIGMIMKKILSLLWLVCFALVPIQEALALGSPDYVRALNEFESIIAKETSAGRMPRQSDPQVGELLNTLTDSKKYLDDEFYTTGSLPVLAINCNRVANIYKAYFLFGIENPGAVLRDPANVSKETKEMVGKNMLTFQPEMMRVQIFFLQCAAKQIEIVRDIASVAELQQKDALKAGMNQIRSGAFGAYSGPLMQATNISSTIESRRMFAAAAANYVNVYAELFTPNIKSFIVRVMTDKLESESDEELKKHFSKILEVMSKNECNQLCKY